VDERRVIATAHWKGQDVVRPDKIEGITGRLLTQRQSPAGLWWRSFLRQRPLCKVRLVWVLSMRKGLK
jgi:hypothetical protein